MEMITYLLGAGASFNSLPLGNKLPLALEELAADLNNMNLESEKGNQNKQILINDLKWLAENARNHETVDSFARKLHMHIVNKAEVLRYNEIVKSIDKKDDYRKLKNALTCFFVIKQYKNLDKRYNKLLSHILRKERHAVYTIKDQVKIISWNYDNQLEIAYGDNYKNSSMEDIFAMLASYPSPYFYNNNSYQPTLSKRNMSVIRLNGVAGLYKVNKDFKMTDIINISDLSLLVQDIVQIYESNETALNFAWDDNETTIDLALSNLIDTTILVIIGYSFPSFNKQVDNQILFSLRKLKKIYIQDLNASALKEKLIRRGTDTKKIEIVCETDVGSFLIPDELE